MYKRRLTFTSLSIYAIMSSTLLLGCRISASAWKGSGADPVTGSLQVSFNMARGEQTVIWLEDKDRNHIKTLFISQWMATDGTWSSHHLGTLSEWRTKAQWRAKNPSQEFVDAVTGATPSGEYSHVEVLDSLRLGKGIYHFCIETSFEDDTSGDAYSILCRGEIELGETESQGTPTFVYSPSEPKEQNRILTNVVAKFTHVPTHPSSAQSLVGHWTFDEASGTTLSNSVDSSLDGKLSSFADNNLHWTGGKIGGAIEFDGVDDVITIPDFAYGKDGTFTVMFWYNCRAAGGDRYRYLFSHGESQKWGNNSVLIYFTRSGSLRTRVCDENDQIEGALLDLSVTDQAPTDGKWHHYALTVSKKGSTVYTDGKYTGKLKRGGDTMAPATDIMLGARINKMDKRFYNGKLDDLRIYDCALSKEEVARIVADVMKTQSV